MPEPVGFAEAFPLQQKKTADWSASTGVTSPRSGSKNTGEEVAPKRKRVVSNSDHVTMVKSGARRTITGRGSTNERQKTTRACDACKARKSRCSGTLPCQRCIKISIPCKYDSPHKRGQPPSPSRGTSIPPDCQPQQPQPVIVPIDTLGISTSELLHREAAVELLHSSSSSPERDTTNVEGQYIRPTSGLAFLHRAKRRLRQDFSSSSRNEVDTPRVPSSIFTFGDKPYPNYSSSTLVLPSRQQARDYVKRYFEFAIPTYRFLHQASVEGWLEKFMNENEMASNGVRLLTDGKAAVVLMVLATATLYRVDHMAVFHDAEAEDYDRSGILFAAAERRLSTETGPPRLESVQARLAQCLYLMGSSRTNQAWYLFGTTAQLILSLGLHNQRYSRSSRTGNGLVEAECRRRVFWSAYTLDKYFTIILGRPGMFRDEDVDQQLPARLNDSDLGEDKDRPRSGWNQCIMDAPVYHIILSRIISGICNDIYSIHPKSLEERLAHTEQRTAELKAWKDSLPAFLDSSKVDPSILVPIFQRQSTVLTLAYAHALILANRQFLLNNFIDLARPVSSTDERVEYHIQECIEAALVAVNIVNNFVENGMLYRTFWFAQYISFCAIATLYVYAIRRYQTQRADTEEMDKNQTKPVPKRGYMEYFEAAEKCRELIASKTENNSPSRRYSIILDELKRQVLAEIEGTPSHLSSHTARTCSGLDSENAPNEDQSAIIRDQPGFVQHDIQLQGPLPDRQSEPLDSGTSSRISLGPTHDRSSTMDFPALANTSLDSEQLGLPFDFIGWPELDSWAMVWPDTSESVDSVQSQRLKVVETESTARHSPEHHEAPIVGSW